MTLLENIKIKTKNEIKSYYRCIFLGDRFLPEVERWFLEQWDCNLPLDYDLDKNSIVFGMSSFEGLCTFEIYHKFEKNIFMFETTSQFDTNDYK